MYESPTFLHMPPRRDVDGHNRRLTLLHCRDHPIKRSSNAPFKTEAEDAVEYHIKLGINDLSENKYDTT